MLNSVSPIVDRDDRPYRYSYFEDCDPNPSDPADDLDPDADDAAQAAMKELALLLRAKRNRQTHPAPMQHTTPPSELEVAFTVLAKADGPLTKRISLTPSGTTHSDGSRCKMLTGDAHRACLGFPHEFAGFIGALEANEAIVLGTMNDGLPDCTEITTKGRLASLNGSASPNLIARTGEYFSYRPREVAPVLIDVDVKAMPDAVRQRMDELGGALKALAIVLPALDWIAHVVRRSTSSGVFRLDTGVTFPEAGGLHIYVPLLVDDAGMVKALLDRMHARAWLAGLGWGMISKGGAFLERSLIDPSVSLPERLVFEADPELGPSLGQDLDQRKPIAHDGRTLTLDDCPDLTEAETAKLRGLIEAERIRLIPEAEVAKLAYVEERTREIRTRKPDMSPAAAMRVALSETTGKLLADSVLVFDSGPSGQPVTVAEVLADPARYVGKALADPIEGRSYGHATAMLLRNADGHLWVKSHAHGGCADDLTNEPVAAAKDTGSSSIAANDILPEIRIEPGKLDQTVNAGEAALIAAKLDVYQRGPYIVRQGSNRIAVSGGRKVDVMSIMHMGEYATMEAMTASAAWKKFDARSKKWVDTDTPLTIVKAFRDRAGRWKLPVLSGIVNAPTLRADGSILAKEGYDEATALLLDFRGVSFPAIPAHPSKADAEAALKLLANLVSTFPFVTEADRSVALSCMLTGAVRGALPNAPMHAFTAPEAGTGKSMLVDLSSLIATGREAGVVSAAKSDEEFEKKLGSMLLSGDPIISVDNIERELGGELLCVVLTQDRAKVRILGRSETPELPCGALITATGNNLAIVGDLARRTVMCRLDAACEKPHEREFEQDPIKMVRADRGKYVCAALTVLRAYTVAGMPNTPKVLGSFADWSDWIRGALTWLGRADPVATMESVREGDPALAAIRAVVAGWIEALANEEVVVKAIIAKANSMTAWTQRNGSVAKHPEFRDALLAVAGIRDEIDPGRLGKWLRAKRNKVIAGHQFVKTGETGGIARWRLQPVKPDAVSHSKLDVVEAFKAPPTPPAAPAEIVAERPQASLAALAILDRIRAKARAASEEEDEDEEERTTGMAHYAAGMSGWTENEEELD